MVRIRWDDATMVTWNAVKGATGYEVCQYKDSSYTEEAGYCEVTETKCNYPVSKDKVFYYGVRAVKEVDGVKYYSDWVNKTAKAWS